MTYERKVESAIRLLQSIPQDGPIEVSYSGGKDSDVILELAKMAGIPFEAIYKQTSIDPPGTTAHAIEMGATVVRPKKTFLQIVREKGMPTRRTRFCCEILKEYKIHDRAIQGIRRSESTARAKRYKEPEMCRLYPKGEKARVYLPILEWTDSDVDRFIKERGIKCAPIYYDEDGKFRVERRLGCVGCPMVSGDGRYDYLKYPKLLKQVIKAEQSFLDNHKSNKVYTEYGGSAYNIAFLNLFCHSKEEFVERVFPPLFPGTGIDTKKFLEDYFKIDLTFECHNV